MLLTPQPEELCHGGPVERLPQAGSTMVPSLSPRGWIPQARPAMALSLSPREDVSGGLCHGTCSD